MSELFIRRAARFASACAVLVCSGVSAAGDAPARPTAERVDLSPLKFVEEVAAPPVNVRQRADEDAVRESQGLPPRYAIPNAVVLNPDNAGVWEDAGNGNAVWRLRVASPGAMSLNFGFTLFDLPEKATLFVYSPDQRHVIRPFTANDNNAHRELWTPVLPGDEAVIELTVPNELFDDVLLELGSINVGYKPFALGGDRDPVAQAQRGSGSCNLDVVCDAADGFPRVDDWRNEIPSVAVISTGGSTFCSGYMVNNVEGDRRPLFITAFHCGVRSGDAPSLVTYWNFENSTCRPPGVGAGGNGNGVLNQFNTGSTLLAEYSPSDVTLFELNNGPNPAWEVTYAGWDARNLTYPGAVAIHHPSTDEKRISFEDDPVTRTPYLSDAADSPSATHIRVEDWDLGTTEPGSSGSPLFSPEGRVIGQLHGGFAACGNDLEDWYGRIHVSWEGGGSSGSRLRDHLDPNNTGTLFVDTLGASGFDVAPRAPITSVGVVGGPFTNDSQNFTIDNTSMGTIDYSVSVDPSSDFAINLSGDPASGNIADGGSVTINAALDASVSGLGAGLYTATVSFESNDADASFDIVWTLEVGQTGFDVTPEFDLLASGPEGGPFNQTAIYTITSTQPTPTDVSVTRSEPWIVVNGGSSASFTLNGVGDSELITVAIDNALASGFAPGLRSGTVTIDDLTGTAPTVLRDVTLDVGRFNLPSMDTPLPITDFNTTTSSITVSDQFCVTDVDVEVAISHTFIGDLEVVLTAPTGVSVVLHDRTGGGANDIFETYDDDGAGILPDGPGILDDFVGEFAQGVWTLSITDNAGADQGTLNSWNLQIASGGSVCPPQADDVSLVAQAGVETAVVLQGASAGSLDHIITTLPSNGSLEDPLAGPILSTPYTLAAGGDTVFYTSNAGYNGNDSFGYRADNGSQQSDLALVSIEVRADGPIYTFNMDNNPGWSTEGQWAWGQPAGLSGDPSSGATGNNVIGYNLNGEYPNNLPPRYLTTQALDFTGVTDVSLRFQRWLGVEHSQWDEAAIEVSNDGVNWSTIWLNPAGFGNSIDESSWSTQEYDISPIADEQPTVFVRWVMGPTDGSVTFHGWNIDDVIFLGVEELEENICRFDFNNDGAVDGADFGDFGAAFGSATGDADYSEQADSNSDGVVDGADFGDFGAEFGRADCLP